MDSSLLTDRILPEDFVALRSVGKRFDEVYSKMQDFARENDVDSSKSKPERFPKAIADILEQVLGTDYGILNPQAEESVKLERELLFVMFLCSYIEVYGEQALFRYRTIDDMCKVSAGYEPFRQRAAEEQQNLLAYANWMGLAIKFRRPNANKGSLLISIPIAAEKRSHSKYVTGTGATRSTKDRIGVFEVEGKTSPAPRPNRRRDDDWTSPAKSTPSATKIKSSPSGSNATNSTPPIPKSENARETHQSTSPTAQANDELHERARQSPRSPVTPKIKEQPESKSQEPEFEIRAASAADSVVKPEEEEEGGEWAFDDTLLEELEKEQPTPYVPSYASQLLQETKLATDFVGQEEDDALVQLVANWDLQKAEDIDTLFDIESR